MYNLISRYMSNITADEVNNFAKSKNIDLNNEELIFVYDFIKKNWEQVIKNPSLLNLDRYKTHFSPDNFVKIKKLFNEYSARYKNLL